MTIALKQQRLIIGLLIMLVAALGCGGTQAADSLSDKAAEQLGQQLGEEFNEANEEAQKVAEQCFELLKSNEMEEYFDCYGPEFYEVTPQEKWKAFLSALDDKLGTLESYELLNWQARVQLESKMAEASTMVVVLTYKTKHTKHEAQEQLTLMKHTDDGSFMIVGHQVQSDALLQ